MEFERIRYTVQLVWSKEFNAFCIMIMDNATGKYLSSKQYQEWIQMVGGIERGTFNGR